MTDLPDYLTDQTEEAILARMLGRVPADIDKSEGSYVWDALAPAAYELFGSAVWAQEVLRRGFASTTFGDYLDLRCAEHGVERRPASAASGQVRFVGRPGMLVPAGTHVATAADPVTNTPSVEFATTADVTLDAQGLGVAAVEAVEAGALGNVAAGAVTLMLAPINGIDSVTNPVALAGGAEAEDDASLLSRYLLRVRSPGTSGNKANYIQWALEVTGIGGVQVKPLWAGPGTVRVALLDSNKRAASPSLVAAVQEYIAPSGSGEGLAPIGADVTVVAAEEVTVNISVKLTLAAGATASAVKPMIEDGIRAYFARLAFADPIVRFTQIAAILLDISPIIDFADLMVNGQQNVNLEMEEGQVAVLGTVTVNV